MLNPDLEKGRGGNSGARRGRLAALGNLACDVALEFLSSHPSATCLYRALGLVILASLSFAAFIEMRMPSVFMCPPYWVKSGRLRGSCVEIRRAYSRQRLTWEDAVAGCEERGSRLADETEWAAAQPFYELHDWTWIRSRSAPEVPKKAHPDRGSLLSDRTSEHQFYACAIPQRLQLHYSGWYRWVLDSMWRARRVRNAPPPYVEDRTRGWREGPREYWTFWERSAGEMLRPRFELWQKGLLEDFNRAEYLASLEVERDETKREL